jgi:cytochrome c5
MRVSVTIAVTAWAAEATFPEGTATQSKTCGACHKAIHNEFAYGFGSDIHYNPTTIPIKDSEKLTMPLK